MNYDEYLREGSRHYEAFARTIVEILRAAIHDSGKEFRVQLITSRAKSEISLRRKLTERGLLESQSIEMELKDLAGCRLVFYTNTDVDRFLNSRLIFENFKVDFDGSKIHHAVGTDRPAEELYFAIHYLVSLTDERLALPEYRKYKGMRCEIQIQTILNHAWAETTHDILYHQPNIKGFGTKQFAAIRERLTKIMNKYLLPAGYEFQTVQHDFERLQQGKGLFDRNTIEALKDADNNNDRYEHLRRIKNDLLPFYDDVPAVAPELIRAIIVAIKAARTSPVKDIETPMGNLPGHKAEQVTDAGLEIIEVLRYINIQETFRVLCDLYASATTDEECRRIIQAAERLAHNDIDVWRQAGYVVQKLLQESISALSDVERTALRQLVLAVAQQILDPELSGSAWHFQSVSLHRGAVQPSEGYGVVRNNTIDLLLDMYERVANEQEKREIILALHHGMQLPGNTSPDNAITATILDNTIRIVKFFVGRADTEELEILQTIEHDYLWRYRYTRDIATAAKKPVTIEKTNAVRGAIEQFRDRANAREQFVLFKALVGYESVFPPEWDGESMDIEGPAAYRAARIAEYVESVTPETADVWLENIRRCAAVRSNDGATFLSFQEFLKQLSGKKPEIVLKYLEKDENALTDFLPAVLQGLDQSEQTSAARQFMERWTDQGCHLRAIARHLQLTKDAPVDLIRKVGEKALDVKDFIALIEIIATIVKHNAVPLIDPIAVPAVQALTETANTRWVNAVWFLEELRTFLSTFSESQSQVLVNNLVLCARIDHHQEVILRWIADKFPAMVWRFFKDRLNRGEKVPRAERYEAIPYRFGSDLQKPLAGDAAAAVDVVRGWYSADVSLFQFRGGKALHNVFPTFSPDLEKKLISVVQEGTDDATDFVLQILRTYQGQEFLHGVCKEIVDQLPADDKRLGEVEVILESTGVVTGQFGFVEAYQQKKDQVSHWLDDSRPKVRAFAGRYQRSLDRAIAAEQRRSEVDYELRRREWPDDEG